MFQLNLNTACVSGVCIIVIISGSTRAYHGSLDHVQRIQQNK